MILRVTEAGFQQTVLDLARLLGYRCYHTYDSRRSEPGFPDLVLVKPADRSTPGRLIFAELKVGKRQVTKEQRAWLADLATLAGHACGQAVEVFIWRPDDWDEIRRVLARGEYR